MADPRCGAPDDGSHPVGISSSASRDDGGDAGDGRRADRAGARRDAVRSRVELGRAGSLVQEDGDDTLILLFTCCHPSLTRPSAIALTLRAVGGLTTAEIAGAFLVPEATMAQRISRAKQRIKTSGVPFRMPTDGERAERLGAVLHVLYLIFNEGYASSAARTLQRTDLSNEAIRLRGRCTTPAGGRRGRRAAGADAPHRRAACRADRGGRRADPARGAGPKAWDGERSPRASRSSAATLSQRIGRRVSAAGRDRRAARRSRACRRH